MSGELDATEKQIVRALWAKAEQLYVRQTYSGKVWTSALKKELGQLGEEAGHRVLHTVGNDKRHEWLWDLCWIRVGEDWRDFRGVELACEMEWNSAKHAVLDDFMKLVAAEARYRVFLFNPTLTMTQQRFDCIAERSRSMPGRRYLVMGLPERKPDSPLVRAWTT